MLSGNFSPNRRSGQSANHCMTILIFPSLGANCSRWIEEVQSMSHDSKYTTDHDEIRKWAEERGGKPVSIERTARKGEKAGLLRIDFPGGATDPPLEPISWEAFFQKFDDAELAMVYQDAKADGEASYFCKFISRDSVPAAAK